MKVIVNITLASIGLFLIAFLLFSCSTDSTTIYHLTTSVEPPEAGSVTKSAAEAEEGEAITITANANEHWVFQEWSGDYTGAQNPAEITMNQDMSITALFAKQDYPLTVETEGDGIVHQEVIQSKTTDYPHGTIVRLTAEPHEGWQFSGWSGAVENDNEVIEVEIEEPMTLTATFSIIEYPVTVEIEGDGAVHLWDYRLEAGHTVSNGETIYFTHGTHVELTAEPSEGWQFTGWSGDEESQNLTISVILEEGPAEFKAMFTHENSFTYDNQTYLLEWGFVFDHGVKEEIYRAMQFNLTEVKEDITKDTDLDEYKPESTYVVVIALGSLGVESFDPGTYIYTEEFIYANIIHHELTFFAQHIDGTDADILHITDGTVEVTETHWGGLSLDFHFILENNKEITGNYAGELFYTN